MSGNNNQDDFGDDEITRPDLPSNIKPASTKRSGGVPDYSQRPEGEDSSLEHFEAPDSSQLD